MKYHIFTLGCQMNIADSERLRSFLDNYGLKECPELDADLEIVVSCSVRQSAIDRIWGKIRVWKKQKSNVKIILTGCILPADQNKLAQYVDGIFNIHNPDEIIKNLKVKSKNEKVKINDFYCILPKIKGKRAYITIMEGCDNFCTYCAVPYTRGREISRPMTDILNEVKNTLNQGYKEIWLLGQNVNSYGKKILHKKRIYEKNVKFSELLQKIDSLPGNFKLNFLSSNPYDFSDELIETLANLKKWPQKLHLPMQSGDDEILRKMNRKYTSGQFLALISKLKCQMPALPTGGLNLKISTDIIVGFPGETKKAFENTVKVCKKAHFYKAYISQYSPRPGTAAAKMKDDVPRAEKKRRWKILDEMINKK